MTAWAAAQPTLTGAPARCVLATLVALALLVPDRRVFATYPGQSGHLAFESGIQTSGTVISTDAGPLTSIAPNESDRSPVYSPDGKLLAFVHAKNLNLASRVWTVEVMSADGGDRRTVVASTAVAVDAEILYVAWRDAQRLVFTAHAGGFSSVWEIGVDGTGLTPRFTNSSVGSSGLPTLFELDGSPLQNGDVLFRCRLRTSPRGTLIDDYCILASSGSLRFLAVEFAGARPDRLRFPGKAHWDPFGTRVVFPMSYTPPDPAPCYPPNGCVSGGCGGEYTRTEIFSMDVVGSALTELTHAPQVFYLQCGGGSITSYAWTTTLTFGDAVVSPDGLTIAGSGYTTGSDSSGTTFGIWTVDADGGKPSLLTTLAANGLARRNLDWQAIPESLQVTIEDGHLNPLKGLKVELLRHSDGELLSDRPINTAGGTYVFDPAPAPGEYEVRVTLVDRCKPDGCVPAFDVRYAQAPAEPVRADFLVNFVAPGEPVFLSFDDADPKFLASTVPGAATVLLDDMAAIYFHTRRFVDWVKGNLVADTGPTVEVYTFATADPFGGMTDPTVVGAYYDAEQTAMVFGPRDSDYENRDGIFSGDPAHKNDGPVNDEWHEFSHHLYHQFVNDRSTCNAEYEPHGGYNNPDTCDSMDEGFSTFLPTVASLDLPVPGVPPGLGDGYYDFFMTSFHDVKIKPWGYRKETLAGVSIVGTSTMEDFAVAGLLWDLFDAKVDAEDTEVIGQDGLHHPVTYTEDTSMSLRTIWTRLTTSHAATVLELHRALGPGLGLTVDLDGNGSKDVTSTDKVFLIHGMFPVENDQQITAGHATYHYDVNYAQRIDPSQPRNAAVGLTSHRVYDATGAVTKSLVPRAHMPAQPHAFVELDVVDASGAPLDGTPHTLTLDAAGTGKGTTTGGGTYGTLTVDTTLAYPGGRVGSLSRRLENGDGVLLHLELPPHFDYLLPTDAPLPPCDPAHDFRVQVTLRAMRDGTPSTDVASFDNCTYFHAMDVATGPAALAYTLTVPVSPIPRVSVSAAPNAGSRFDGWSGPDAAECATGSVLMTADKRCVATFDLGAPTSTTSSTSTTTSSTSTVPTTVTTTTTSTTASTSTTTTSTTSSTTTTTLFACGAGPVDGCQPAAAKKAKVQLGPGKLSWEWTSQADVLASEFGDPSTVTEYLLCVYDQAGARLGVRVHPGGSCGTRSPKPCWKLHELGYDYADKAGVSEGVKKISLRAGAPGKAKLKFVSAGSNFPVPTLPLATPVRVQLRSSTGRCWDATYSAGTNTAKKFKANSD